MDPRVSKAIKVKDKFWSPPPPLHAIYARQRRWTPTPPTGLHPVIHIGTPMYNAKVFRTAISPVSLVDKKIKKDRDITGAYTGHTYLPHLFVSCVYLEREPTTRKN